MDNAAPLLGKCKECDYAIFATREDVQEATAASDVRKGTGVWRWNNSWLARCSNGHKWFVCKAVKGTYSENHKCDARCLNAKGNDCTCSCGGANHGRGHAVTVVNAAELPSPTTDQFFREMRDARVENLVRTAEQSKDIREQVWAEQMRKAERTAGRHLGEVGKHIRGEVIVSRVVSGGGHVDYTTYEFLTEGGDKIVWFAPVYADPQWEQGKTLTIRAKVKRHESHERFGNSTVVIYVEEVE
jgi:hypothetical protein